MSAEIPGPASRAYAQRLRASESRGVTYLADDFPVFWESASGATIVDVDGNRYTDLTSAFGVASVGHANPAVTRAIAEQARRLPHGMGDVHPCDARLRLTERLIALAPVERGRAFLCSTGAETVEFALKTAMLATENAPDALAFVGGYHGLSYGTLEIAGNPWFREPWRRQLRDTTTFAPFPDVRRPGSREHALEYVEKALRKNMAIGAVIVEPIQGRAGVILPPPGFLIGLRALCDEYNAVLILDEIFTGLGRTGRMFAADHEAVKPDIICLGKALGGGFPISAAIGSQTIMEAWPTSTGEALHTSTYLGNPMGCAAALAVLDEIERGRLVERSATIGERLGTALHPLTEIPGVRDTRGLGAFRALELRDGATANRIVVRALARGVILLQAGIRGENIQLAPPLTIDFEELDAALAVLGEVVRECVAG